jgi:hypothetical protein
MTLSRRINVSNKLLPGITSESVPGLGTEIYRFAIFDSYNEDEYLGEVVYMRRKLSGARGSQYGWRPAQSAPQSKLTTKVDAIKRLTRFEKS